MCVCSAGGIIIDTLYRPIVHCALVQVVLTTLCDRFCDPYTPR